jgi:CTP synthase
VEALRHAAITMESELNLRWVSSEDLESQGTENFLMGVSGILVPVVSASGGLMARLPRLNTHVKIRFPSWVYAWGCSVL